MKTIYLSLGSNVGERERNIARAVEALPAHGIRLARLSSLYVTEPVDFPMQGWFLNCVAEAQTDLLPLQLLHAIRRIEMSLGRKQLVRSGPRVIDLDILLFGSASVRAPDLEIPHPRMAERRFVLVPLHELAPALHHTALHKTVAELLAETNDRSQVRLWHPQRASAAAS